MKLEDMKRIAAARTKGDWKSYGQDIRISYLHHDHRMAYTSNEENAEFIAMAANNIDLLFECGEFVKTVAPSWLPDGIRIRRLELLRALEES